MKGKNRLVSRTEWVQLTRLFARANADHSFVVFELFAHVPCHRQQLVGSCRFVWRVEVLARQSRPRMHETNLNSSQTTSTTCERRDSKRAPYQWPPAAVELVIAQRDAASPSIATLVTQLTHISGFPRHACYQLLRKYGIAGRSRPLFRRWSESEDHRLLELIENHSPADAARILGRSRLAVLSRLAHLGGRSFRKRYRWSPQARRLVIAYRKGNEQDVNELINALAVESGNPRRECWRFVHRMGIKKVFRCRPWTESEQRRLLHLIEKEMLPEVAKTLRRSERAVRVKLEKLGVSASIGKDWFTPVTLARALHTSYDKVQQWIDRGLLKATEQSIGTFKRFLITSDDFCRFCHEHRREAIGRRLNVARLDFIQGFVFPASHTELLPVRASKRERAAWEAQIASEAAEEISADDPEGDCDEAGPATPAFPVRREESPTGSMRGEVCA